MASKRPRSGGGRKRDDSVPEVVASDTPATPAPAPSAVSPAAAAAASGGAPAAQPGPDIKWDQSQMRSAYANVCNVVTTREEFILMFGTNQAFDAAQNEVTVKLSSRLVFNPQAAKRIAKALGGVMREYEARYGEVKA
jgi:hypothetical protein